MHVNIESLRKSMRKIVETDNDTGNRCTWVLNPGDSIDVVQACEGSKVCRRCGQLVDSLDGDALRLVV